MYLCRNSNNRREGCVLGDVKRVRWNRNGVTNVCVVKRKKNTSRGICQELDWKRQKILERSDAECRSSYFSFFLFFPFFFFFFLKILRTREPEEESFYSKRNDPRNTTKFNFQNGYVKMNEKRQINRKIQNEREYGWDENSMLNVLQNNFLLNFLFSFLRSILFIKTLNKSTNERLVF